MSAPDLGTRATVSARTGKGLAARAIAVAAVLSLAGCSASHTGHVAIAMDPAGRVQAVLGLCDQQRLASLTLTDETTGTSETTRPKESPAFGATVILTGPIVAPHPEGIFDLLDRAHDYTLSGTTKKVDAEKESGTLGSVRFTLDAVAKEPKLRQDSVLAIGNDDAITLMTKADFVKRATEECS